MLRFIVQFLVALTLVASLQTQASGPSSTLKQGMTAPNWMLSDIEGDVHSLYSELDSGNEVIMVFWASWCQFCRELLPELNLFKTSLSKEPVKIFAMNIWEDGDPVGYFDSRNIDLSLLLKAEAVAKRYGIAGTPGVVFVGKNKTIRYLRDNGEDTSAVMKQLQSLILEKHLKK